MKFLHLFLLSVCLVEIYGQRSRTTSTNQDASKDAPAPVRTRGRARFSSTEEFAKIPEQPTRTTSNRRASTRTRIHSNNPKAAADRRAQPTEAPRGYAVEEINNDSPIDSFRRQSKSRVLTESRFEVADASAARRPVTYEASTPLPPVVNAVPVEDLGFGSTARAILQSRGESLPGKTTTPVVDEEYLLTNFGSTIRSFRGDSAPTKPTTTPVVDEEYLLTNFGSTIRSLAAASRGAQVALSRSRPRNDIPVQKATPIRSEIPILDREDIPARRSSIRGEPLPSLRNSDITIEREPPARSRNSAKAKLAEARENARIESEKKLATEEAVIEDFVRVAPEPEAPEAVQGLPEQSELITETHPFEVSSETVLLEEEEVRRTPAVEISTPSSTYSLPTKRVVTNGRRSGASGRSYPESAGTQSPRSRPTRPPRPSKKSEDSDSGSPVSSRARIGSRRRFDDAVVAESRHRGPSVFTAEQYQDVTARSRTGRRIDSRYESVPERISVDLTPTTTIRSRTSGRRATTAGSTTTDRASVRDRNTRGRGRSRSEPSAAASTNKPSSRRSSYVEESRPNSRSRDNGRKLSIAENTVSSNRRNKEESVPVTRRPNNVEEVVLYGERSDNARDIITRTELNELKVNSRRGSSVQTAPPSRRRGGGNSRFEIPDDIINERVHLEQTRKEKPSSRFDVIQTRTRNPNRNAANSKQTESVEETTIYYGEKSRRTDPPDTTTSPTTTTTTEKPVVKSNARSRSRFPEAPPRLDESKLEVLPLFEREPKTVASTRSRGQRSRSVSRRNSEDHMHISATENDVRFIEKPTTSAFTRVTVTRTESIEASTSRARLSTRTASPTTTETPRRSSSSSSSSSSTIPSTRVVTTTTTTTKRPVTTTRASETTTKKWVTRSPPVIKESVVAEINQVTSKSTITRRKKVPKAKAAEMLSRGTKKADIKLADVGKKKNSDEEIDEEDNYPEPFKALIQAKKNKVLKTVTEGNTMKTVTMNEPSRLPGQILRLVQGREDICKYASNDLQFSFQDESRPQQSSTRSATSATIAKSTTTERVIVTSANIPRSSSTARVVTTTVAPRKTQELDDFINETENELDPKPVTSSTTTTTRPTRGRQLPKFSEKPKYQQRHKEKFGKSTEKPRFSSEKHATKTTSAPRKTYSTKSYSTRASSEHHLRRKALRSTAFPPSTTPLTLVNREGKFSAKFVKKENKAPETSTTDKSVKFVTNQLSKGLHSSRKGSSKEYVDGEEKVARQLDVSLFQSVKPTQSIKKFSSSRYSSRYRSDSSTRSSVLKSTTSAPFYIPTIPTPAYLPTVPTVTPPVTPVDGIVAVKDGDLGVEVISFDDPINFIPSADLVNGEYLTTDKNLKLSPTVKEGTTEKPVSIIERIINSITLISTTAAPNTSTINSSSTTTEAPGNSAILKLATKKTTPKDKTKPDVQTNIIETITSEKPTTIIEKIRSSLSAIQTNEVGTSDFDIVSSSSTTPLSTVTKYSAKYRGSSVGTTALPAPQPLSTSINPLSVFDEIDKNQVLEKRTIGKLLNILNGLVSTESSDKAAEKLVVVTPKNSLSSAGFVATTFSPQEPIEAIPLNAIEPRAGFSNLPSTTSLTTESLPSTVNTESTTLSSPTVNTEASSISTPLVNTDSTTVEAATLSTVNTDSTTVEAATLSTEPANTEMSTLEASTVTMPLETTTSTPLASNTETLTTTDLPITTTQPPSTADNTGSILYTFPSTIPSIPTIKVESNRMARILETEQRSTASLPRVVITSTTTSAPVSTTSVSSTTSSTTTNAPKSTTTLKSMPSTTEMESTMTSTPGTTLLTSTMTMNTASTTLAPTVVIMAVPGETRISKSQTTTARNTETSTKAPSTAEATTAQASSSTIMQSTETIPPTLGEILNGRTFDALNNLIKSELPSTKAPNYKNLQVNQNAIISSTTTTDSSTLTTAQSTDSEAPFTSSILSTENTRQIPSSSESNTVLSTSTDASTITTALPTDGDAPFTSMLSTERTTQIPNTSNALLSSTLITTIMPESVTTQRTTTTTTTQPTTTTLRTTTPEIKTTTRKIETTTRRLTTTPLPKTTTEGFPTYTPSTIFPSILTTLFPSLMRGGLPTESHISSTRRPFSSDELTNSIGDRFEILSTAGTTAQPSTVRPPTSSQRISTTTPPTTTTRPTTTITQTTTQSTTTTTTTTTTTEKPTTTTRITTRKPKPKPTTAIPKVSDSGTPMPTTKEETDKVFEELKKSGKLKDLNEEQRRNLEEIEKIEKEQGELLKQLSLLTTMFGGQNGRAPNVPMPPNPLGGNSNSLANRIIAMAMERDKARGSESSPVPSSTLSPAPSPTTTTKKPTRRTTKRPNSIQDQLPITKVEDATKKTTPSLEDVLKQYNLNGLTTPVPLTSTYGKTDEAVVAAILKEHGIGPTTPKILGDKVKEAGIFEEVPTTKKPKPRARPVTTTARPLGGRLMQGLNWLLDILDPPTTKKPSPRKPKPKTQTPKQSGVEDELLTNQPTRITPMVTAAPATRPSLSQDEIRVLIKQLESAQANPETADQLDFSKIKSLQNLIDGNEGVQVTHTGQHGATSRATPRPPKIKSTTSKDPLLAEINRKPKASTISTLSVSNSVDDDVELISTTVRNRVMPPVSLNPIPGIDDTGDSVIRSNLLTAAVNVTRAISSFLGSAIQDASHQVRAMFYNGSSGIVNTFSAGSSVPSIASASSGVSPSEGS